MLLLLLLLACMPERWGGAGGGGWVLCSFLPLAAERDGALPASHEDLALRTSKCQRASAVTSLIAHHHHPRVRVTTSAGQAGRGGGGERRRRLNGTVWRACEGATLDGRRWAGDLAPRGRDQRRAPPLARALQSGRTGRRPPLRVPNTRLGSVHAGGEHRGIATTTEASPRRQASSRSVQSGAKPARDVAAGAGGCAAREPGGRFLWPHVTEPPGDRGSPPMR
ncbi:unnamed protein product [Lampetra fluviatilis]